MKFKIDENLPSEIRDLLLPDYDVATVLDQKMGGSLDPNLAKICRRENRILITLDKDFSDIRNYPPKDHPGLMVLRLGQQDKPHILAIFRNILALLKHEPLQNHLWIVEEDRIRIRS